MSGIAHAEGSGSAVHDALEELALDTMRGLCVMVMPGPDAWSSQQGTPRTDPGPIEVGGGEFMKGLFDNYQGVGDQLARPLALAIAQTLSDLGIQTGPFLGLSEHDARRIDEALGYVYSDRTFPLSIAVSLLLNAAALVINPHTIAGPLGSPFSRLSLAEKMRVLEQLEGPIPHFASSLDKTLPVPLRGSASGFLRFTGGIILESTAFGVYSELDNYDPETRQVHPRPVAWDLTGYRPNGLVDGHPEFQGYYQGRMEVPADA